MRIIKKYPNRRLYDTALGSYITLDDIRQLVLDHIEFQIIDVSTKNDLTQAILLQIIIEQETTGTPIFTTALLQDFIRFYQEKSQPIVSRYLQQMMQLFVQQKTFFEEHWPSSQKQLTDPLFLKQTMDMQKIFIKEMTAHFTQAIFAPTKQKSKKARKKQP